MVVGKWKKSKLIFLDIENELLVEPRFKKLAHPYSHNTTMYYTNSIPNSLLLFIATAKSSNWVFKKTSNY